MVLRFRLSLLPALALALVFTVGCYPRSKPITTTGLQAQKMDRAMEHPRDHWQLMADNAMLSDMTVWDHNFVGHSAELSGTGAERLSRMAVYLDTYGGKIRYDTQITDEDLIKDRLAHVKEFLEVAGADMSNVELAADMPGGRVMTALETFEVMAKGTAAPQGQSGPTTVLGGSAPNP